MLDALPKLQKKKKITSLYLGGAKLTTLDRRFAVLAPSVTHVSLRECPMTELPEVLTQFKKLEILVLRDMDQLKAIPDLSPLNKLRIVDLCGAKKLKDFSGLATRPALADLDISNIRRLKTLPTPLTEIPTLKTLRIHTTPIDKKSVREQLGSGVEVL